MLFRSIKYGTQNKRQLLSYLGIGRSLTKGCESCCWHTWIRTQVPSTAITPYEGTALLRYVYFKYYCLIQTNILSGNGMTNSMQATLSKAAIYTKQPTRE